MTSEVGSIIWNQIPIMTKMACGARQPYLLENGIEFRAGRNLRIRIELEASDTYKVEAYRLKRGTYEKLVLNERGGVYAEELGQVIYHAVNK